MSGTLTYELRESADSMRHSRSRADVTVVQPLQRQSYGETEFEIRDPNGYVLVFAERL